MAGKIHRYDCYDLRKYHPEDIKTFVDIGANVGTTTIMARLLMPASKVVAFEPCRETYNALTKNLEWLLRKDFLECHNIALGDGSDLCFQGDGTSGLNKFLTLEERTVVWPGEYDYTTLSRPLVEIFDRYSVDTESPFIIKIDCEGGERFILEQQECWPLLQKAVQINFEIHVGLGGTCDEWNTWFDMMSETHELREARWIDKGTQDRRYRYIPVDKITNSGEYELMNKKWIISHGY